MMRHLLQLMSAIVLTFINIASAYAADGVVSAKGINQAKAEIVKVGFYPINVYAVDPTSGTFSYDGYVWLRWNSSIDPTKTLEFANSVDKSSISKEFLFDRPQEMPDGSKYQIMRIESKFYIPFSLSKFPLDDHDLTIAIEDSLRGSKELTYEIDSPDTGYSSTFSVSGWKITGWTSKLLLNKYGSNFGDKRSSQASEFSRMAFNIGISRPVSYFIWKLLLPLVVVLCGAWIALLLSPALTETRAALPASALLTTVFLQQSYTASLPDTGGLVLLDQIYVVAYVLIVVTLARVIMKSRIVDDMDETQLRALRKKDGIVLCIQVAIFGIATASIILWR